MKPSPRTALIVLALLAVAILAAGGSGTWSAFSATTSNGATSLSSAADWTAPSVGASVIAHSSKGPGVKANGTYNVYANVTDSGNPASGVSTVTANVGSVTTGSTAIALTTCSSSCTVGGVTYGYKSAQLTSNSGLSAGSVSYTVSAKDTANNSSSAFSFSVTVENTAPSSITGAVAHANVGPGAIKSSGTYTVYANATDTGSGVDTVSANVSTITTGQSAVTLSTCASSCSVNGVTYAYKSAQLTANSGLSTNKSFTVTATDAAGNAGTSSSLTATVDNTAPTATGVASANGGSIAGRPEHGDTITLTRSEQMDPNSILSAWTGTATNVVVRITNTSGSNDLLTVWNSSNTTQLPLGSVNLGAAGYVNTNSTVTFGATGTASSMVQAAGVVTITLGTPSTTARTVSSTTKMIWTPSSSATDLAGNAASTTAFTQATAVKQF